MTRTRMGSPRQGAIALATLAVVAAFPAMAQGPASLADTVALGTFLDGAIAEQLEQLRMSGAVVAVVQGNRVLALRGYGWADRERKVAVDPNTSMFQIGSTGKLFTWTAVMQLVERGQLDLDLDINKYLKTFQIPATFPQPITLRHLMTHTAGFQEGVVGYFIGSDSTNIRSIEETLRGHIPARVRPPGLIAAYSNYGAALAGLIVEQTSGMPFAEFIEKNIYAPLGIRYATFREPIPPQFRDTIVTRYGLVDGAFVRRPPEINGGFTPAGGTFVSGAEMAKFMIAHLQGGRFGDGRILEPATAALMHRTTFTHDPRIPGVALGFIENRINGRRVIGHDGDSYDLHVAEWLVPEDSIGLFVGYSGEEGVVAREALARIFFDRYLPSTETPLPVSTTVALDDYVGRFRTVRRNYTDIDKLLYLIAVPPIDVSRLPDDRLLVTGAEGPGSEPIQLEPVGPDLFREVGADRLAAFRRENGKVTGIFMNPTAGSEPYPRHDQAAFWYPVLALTFLLFLSLLAKLFFQRQLLRTRSVDERRAFRLAGFTIVWLLTSIMLAGLVAAIYQAEILQAIPFALKAVLAMPVVFVLLSGWMVLTTVNGWRNRWGTAGERIHYSLVTLGAVAVSAFFLITNVFGWQFG